MLVYIIGYMGSGKSTLGKKLAARMEWDFIDLDCALEKAEGISVNEIFITRGEEYFRKKERQLLHETGSLVSTIISCGGGTPCFFDNMQYMNDTGLTLYLKMTPRALLSRLEYSKSSRPLIRSLEGEQLLSFLESSLAEREKWYLKASLITSGLDADINRIADLLREHPLYNR